MSQKIKSRRITDTARPTKEFSPAIWETLERLGTTAEDVAGRIPEIGVLQAALELQLAGARRRAREREIRDRLRGAEPIIETRAERIVNGQLRSLWRSSSSGRVGGNGADDTEVLADNVADAVSGTFA